MIMTFLEKKEEKRRRKLERKILQAQLNESSKIQRTELSDSQKLRIERRRLKRERKNQAKRDRKRLNLVSKDIWRASHALFLKTPQWREFREIIIFDRKVCQKCSSKKKLNVHHKHYRTYRNERKKDVLLLCEDCHLKLHENHSKHPGLGLEAFSDQFLTAQ